MDLCDHNGVILRTNRARITLIIRNLLNKESISRVGGWGGGVTCTYTYIHTIYIKGQITTAHACVCSKYIDLYVVNILCSI